MLLGFLLMGGIPQLMRLAFPAEMKEIESEEEDGIETGVDQKPPISNDPHQSG